MCMSLMARLGSLLHSVSTWDLLQAIGQGSVMIWGEFRKMNLAGLKWGEADGIQTSKEATVGLSARAGAGWHRRLGSGSTGNTDGRYGVIFDLVARCRKGVKKEVKGISVVWHLNDW